MPTYPNLPVLSRRPALKTKGTTLDPTLRDSLENGMESTRARFTRRRREWDVTYEYMNALDVAAFDTFVETTVVFGAGAFNFIDVYGNNFVVRFSKLPAYQDASWVEDGFRQNVTFSVREV